MASAYSVFANGRSERRDGLLDALAYARTSARCYGYATLRINGELVRSFNFDRTLGEVVETAHV